MNNSDTTNSLAPETDVDAEVLTFGTEQQAMEHALADTGDRLLVFDTQGVTTRGQERRTLMRTGPAWQPTYGERKAAIFGGSFSMFRQNPIGQPGENTFFSVAKEPRAGCSVISPAQSTTYAPHAVSWFSSRCIETGLDDVALIQIIHALAKLSARIDLNWLDQCVQYIRGSIRNEEASKRHGASRSEQMLRIPSGTYQEPLIRDVPHNSQYNLRK